MANKLLKCSVNINFTIFIVLLLLFFYQDKKCMERFEYYLSNLCQKNNLINTILLSKKLITENTKKNISTIIKTIKN